MPTRLPAVLLLGFATPFLAQGETPAPSPSAWQPQSAGLLYATTRDGNGEIYVRRAGSAEAVNLTKHEAGDNWPVGSPDGKRIVFQSKRAGNLDIWVMRADGSEPVQLTNDPEPDYLPAWSPDGTRIVFTSWRHAEGEKRAPHLYVMKADGTEQRRLVAASLDTSAGATFSPDGKLVVYSRATTEETADVYVADADGGNERRLTQEKNAYNGSPEFSPDGRKIAFYSALDESSALVVMNADGSERRTVLAEGQNWYPRWSPDGKWLIYTAAAKGGKEGNCDLLAVPAEGGQPVVLLGGEHREAEGSWLRSE